MTPSPTDLRVKVRWLIAIRLVISTLLLGTATFARITAPGSFAVDPFFFLIGLTFALTVMYAAVLRFVDRHTWLVDVQLAGDALVVSAFIHFTGGTLSYFPSLYVLPIAAAATVQRRRGGLMVATLSAIVYGGIVLAQYTAGSGPLGDWTLSTNASLLPPRSVAAYMYSLNVLGFFAVAWLSGSLADRLESAGARLLRASNKIADLQALNQHVIDSLPSGLATTDSALHILTFNPAAETITGLTFRSVFGRPIDEVLQLPAKVIESLSADLGDDPVARRFEFHFQRDASRIEIGLTAANLETPSGRAGFLFTFQDVTFFKKLERDVRMQQRLAAVGEMAAGIAHEIRNPLASMSGSIQILREELPLSAEQEQLMDIVLRESARLNATIRSFLAYARPQASAITRFDVRRVLKDTVLLLRNGAGVHERHIIELEVPPYELWYEADEGHIKQIVWNLATNGLRAMPEGGRLRLAASVDVESNGIAIAVGDEGIGIASDQLDSLFQPFHGKFVKGSGLGLAIVHRIVTDYNGEIQVSSKPGQGTMVSVHLPAPVMVMS